MGIALWQKRDMEQHELIEGIMKRVRDAADQSGPYEPYMLRFATDVAAFAANRFSCVPLVPADKVGMIGEIYEKEIVPFARLESERLYMLSRLMKEVQQIVYTILGHAYSGDTVSQADKIFGGDPTDEEEDRAES